MALSELKKTLKTAILILSDIKLKNVRLFQLFIRNEEFSSYENTDVHLQCSTVHKQYLNIQISIISHANNDKIR